MKGLTFQSTIRVSQVNTNTRYKVWANYDEVLKFCEWANYAHSITWLFLSRMFPKQSTPKFITTRLLKTKSKTETVFLNTAEEILYLRMTRNFRKGGMSF